MTTTISETESDLGSTPTSLSCEGFCYAATLRHMDGAGTGGVIASESDGRSGDRTPETAADNDRRREVIDPSTQSGRDTPPTTGKRHDSKYLFSAAFDPHDGLYGGHVDFTGIETSLSRRPC